MAFTFVYDEFECRQMQKLERSHASDLGNICQVEVSLGWLFLESYKEFMMIFGNNLDIKCERIQILREISRIVLY